MDGAALSIEILKTVGNDLDSRRSLKVIGIAFIDRPYITSC